METYTYEHPMDMDIDTFLDEMEGNEWEDDEAIGM